MSFQRDRNLPYSEYCHLGVASKNFALNLREIVTNNEDVIKMLQSKEELDAETKKNAIEKGMDKSESKLLKNATCARLECSTVVEEIHKAIRERAELRDQLEDAETELKMQIADLAPVQYEYELRELEKKRLDKKLSALRYQEQVELKNKKTELMEELTAMSILVKERGSEMNRMKRESVRGPVPEESHINFVPNKIPPQRKKHTGTYVRVYESFCYV
jgi:hypothetical protein